MDEKKKQRLEAVGWQVGDAQDFLGLSDEEMAAIDKRVSEVVMQKERRTFALDNIEVRTKEDGVKEVRGHAAVFDSLSGDLGGFREKIEPGAFRESVDGDVLAFWNHNSDIVLGRTPETLSIEEDEHGLAFTLTPPESRADLMESIERRDVRGTSFGFQTIEDKWEKVDGEDIRTLMNVRLIEISPTPLPAYPDTDVSVARRSRDAWAETVKRDLVPDIDIRRRRLRLLEVA